MHDPSETAARSRPVVIGGNAGFARWTNAALATVIVAALAVLPPVAEGLDESFLIGLFTRILIFALAAASLDLILGFGGMVSFGHSAYFGAGAYVVAVTSFHGAGGDAPAWPFALAWFESALAVWPLAVGAAALLALLIGAVSLRTSGMYFIMITLAFAQMLYYFFVSLEVYGGDDGLSIAQRNRLTGLDLENETAFYYVCLLILAVCLLLGRRLVRSRFGMVLQGCKENEERMLALGFPVYRYKLTAFVLAGAAAGLAGALMANYMGFVDPALMHWTVSGEIMVMVILGGMGTLAGPVIGAAVLLLLEEILSAYMEHWMIILGPVLILVVLFARRGIWGWFERGKDAHV
ncbi:MAG: branched-chain amino acid ABC transporter permease [Deltaproteobacteria bacterium]|nr:branched-chain amino acid ABC transporter permease [Deltaproteobacteria bacterium]